MESTKSEINSYQNVIVMRQGDRMDFLEPLWASNAKKPWDTPLVQDGMTRAFQTGQRLRSQLGFPIHRVFVSPFLRCIQTANEVVVALSAVQFDPNAMSSTNVPSIDNTKLKVSSIEYGLCKVMNTRAKESEPAPIHKEFEFNIKDLEAMFPERTVDSDVGMVYKELPQWEEYIQDYTDRYVNTLKGLADKYSSENLLLVTHWGGVSTTRNNNFINTTTYKVDYCGSVELRRQIMNSNDEFGKSKEFEMVTSHGVSFKHHTVPIHPPVTKPISGLV